MSDKETLINLSKSDLVIFPYQFTNDSASGARMKVAISVKRGSPIGLPLPPPTGGFFE